MATRIKYGKYFRFEEKERPNITLSDKTKIFLNPKTNRIELRPTFSPYFGKNVYPTDSGLYVKSPYWEPAAVKDWIGFEEVATTPTGTSVGHVLDHGTDQLYWDGSWKSWDHSTWNTEAEIIAHIATFPVTSKKIAVLSNLKTTDKFETPLLYTTKILGELEVSPAEDLLYRTLVPQLRAAMRVIKDYFIEMTGDDSFFYLNDTPSEMDFNIYGVDAVYNHTNDPNHMTNRFLSYDSATTKVTLGSAQSTGDEIFVRVILEPIVAVSPPNVDYTELEKLPAVTIEGFTISGESVLGERFVRDMTAGTAVVNNLPIQADIDFNLVLTSESGSTLQRMIDAGFAFVRNNPTIVSAGIGELYNLTHAGEPTARPTPGSENVHAVTLPLRIEKAYFWLDDQSEYLVQTIVRSYQRKVTSGVGLTMRKN